MARRGLGSCLARGLERWRVYASLSRGPQEELMRRRMSTYIARMRLSGRGTTAKNASVYEAHKLNEAVGNLPFVLIGEHNARMRLALAAWHAHTWSTRATRSRSPCILVQKYLLTGTNWLTGTEVLAYLSGAPGVPARRAARLFTYADVC